MRIGNELANKAIESYESRKTERRYWKFRGKALSLDDFSSDQMQVKPMKSTFSYEYEHFDDIERMPEADRTLIEAARQATRNAHAPYSHFRVGAAARLRSGRILHGSNIESEVFPAGLCAERSLLFYIGANHADDPVEALAIASVPSEQECYPCGQCRQVLLDVERRQNAPIRIIMSGNRTASVVDSAVRLLPFTFKL